MQPKVFFLCETIVSVSVNTKVNYMQMARILFLINDFYTEEKRAI